MKENENSLKGNENYLKGNENFLKGKENSLKGNKNFLKGLKNTVGMGVINTKKALNLHDLSYLAKKNLKIYIIK